MGRKQSSGSYEFKGADVSVRVPLYLHQRKAIPFFEARSKKDSRPLLHFTVGLLDDDGVKVQRDVMMRMQPGAIEEWSGVRRHVIRRGKAPDPTDSLELLVSLYNTLNGAIHHSYDVLFPLGSRWVSATFFGQGELASFEESCKQIVSSIRLVEAGEAQLPAPRRRWATGGLGLVDTKQLKQALDGLPAEIAYLRKAILAIAKQDQDLLGSGEANTDSIDKAVRKAAGSGAAGAVAVSHADMLRAWLMTLPDHEGAWAASAWFVEGFLRGFDLFGAGSEES